MVAHAPRVQETKIMVYCVNPLSVLIIPRVDKANGFETIVYEVEKDMVLRVRPFGYWILRLISFCPNLDLAGVIKKLTEIFPKNEEYKNETKIRAFIDLMVKRKIIIDS